MDERLVLSTRLEDLNRKLDWISHILEETRQVDETLYDRLSVRFAQIIAGRKRQIKMLKSETEASDVLPKDLWKSVEEIDGQCTSLAGETLAFLGGLLVRRYELDHLTCLIADNLCDHWCKTAQVAHGLLTIPAVGDSFTDQTHIVRVSFPEFSIWRLPIVAHEFGHYLEAERRDRYFPYLFSDILNSEQCGLGLLGKEERILQEQFADLFAVYALGPAYVCTCILLEFNPYLADRDSSTHPSYAKRAHFLLHALNKMQAGEAAKPFRWISNQLSERWEVSLKAVGRSEAFSAEEAVRLNARLSAMYDVIDHPKNQMTGARYQTARWSRVQSLQELLANPASTTHASVDVPNPETLADIINAAWLCRLLNDRLQPDSISRQALTLCNRVIDAYT